MGGINRKKKGGKAGSENPIVDPRDTILVLYWKLLKLAWSWYNLNSNPAVNEKTLKLYWVQYSGTLI